MSLSGDLASYLNSRYRTELDGLVDPVRTEQSYITTWPSYTVKDAPAFDVYAAFRFVNGFLASRGEKPVRLVVEGGAGKNRFESL